MSKLMDKNIFIYAIFILCLITLPTKIGAVDFILKVPVELNNLASDITQVKVYCQVSKSRSFGPSYESTLSGSGYTNTVNISDRKFKGVLIARITCSEGKDPHEVKYYKIYIRFKGKGGWFKPRKNDPKYPADPTKPYQTGFIGNF